MMSSGTTVTIKSMSLKISAALPSKNRLVKSLVYKGNVPAACSKAAQKKTVNKQKIVKAIIRSRSILVYRGILMIRSKIKDIAAKSAKNNESFMPATVKLSVLI